MPKIPSRWMFAAALLLTLTPLALAADYPDRPVRLIIPFPPGGSNDVVGRLVAQQLTAKLGQQVYVDTRDKGFQERFAQLVAERRANLEHTFARFGVDVIRLTTDTDLVQTLVRFAHLRKETGRRGNRRAALGAMV